MFHLCTESMESAEASKIGGISPGFWCLGKQKMRSEFFIIAERKGRTGEPVHGCENGDDCSGGRGVSGKGLMAVPCEYGNKHLCSIQGVGIFI